MPDLNNLGDQAVPEHIRFVGLPFSVQPSRKQLKDYRAFQERIIALRTHTAREQIRDVTLLTWVAGHPEPVIWELCENLYETLSQLPNLQSVACAHTLMKTEHFQKLVGRTGVRKLGFENCTFSFDDTMPYHLEDVTLVEPYERAKVSGFAGRSVAYSATTVLKPEDLQTAVLLMPFTMAELLPQLTTQAPFEKLTSLTLSAPAKDEAGQSVIEFLARCPNVEDLVIVDYGFSANPLADLDPSALPKVKSYGGSPRTLLHILPGRTIGKWTLESRFIGPGKEKEEYGQPLQYYTAAEVRAATAAFSETAAAQVKHVKYYVKMEDPELKEFLAAKFKNCSNFEVHAEPSVESSGPACPA